MRVGWRKGDSVRDFSVALSLCLCDQDDDNDDDDDDDEESHLVWNNWIRLGRSNDSAGMAVMDFWEF